MMAINFTEPSRKNITVQFESQDKTELSSTIGGDSVKIDVNRPDKFKTPTVGDAVDLSDILEGIDIRYVASTAGYSHGDTVDSWTNSGSLSEYDLSNGFDSTVTHPTFDIGGTNNPFSNGAMRFVLDTDGNTSQHLHWGDQTDGSGGSFNVGELTEDGAFSMYMVVSKDNVSGGNQRRMSSPLWVRGTTPGQAELQSTPAFQVVRSTDLFVLLKGGGYDSVSAEFIHRGGGDSDMSPANGEAMVVIVTVDSDNNFSCFDFNAKNFVNEKKSIGSFDVAQTKGVFIANSFGGPTIKPIGMLPFDQESTRPQDGDAIYIAEFGFFSKKLEGQQASALGRLLKEKYQIS